MPKAKKLPSGNWRTRIYIYTDTDSKKHYKSFTASTKKESERLAAEYIFNSEALDDNTTVHNAVSHYISVKEGTLSPTTITSYNSILRNHYDEISNYKLKALNTAILQSWVGNLNKRLSAKTIKNAHGLLMSTLDMYDCKKKFKVTLPESEVKIFYVPTDQDVLALINYFNERSPEMAKAVCLSAYGTLRRGEICALTADDVVGNKIIINKAMIPSSDNTEWIIKKTPKRKSSNRVVEYPQFVIDMLPKEGRLVDLFPDSITTATYNAVIELGLNYFNFHGLRHYSASIMHAQGIPDQYIMKRGGWSTDKTLKKIYRNILEDYDKKNTDKINSYFEKIAKV